MAEDLIAFSAVASGAVESVAPTFVRVSGGGWLDERPR